MEYKKNNKPTSEKIKEYNKTAYEKRKEDNLCEHNKQKEMCRSCDGSALCLSTFCDTTANPKYDNYCLRCHVHLFPDIPNTRNYKTKEKTVTDFIINAAGATDLFILIRHIITVVKKYKVL